MEQYKARRAELAKQMQNSSVAILPSAQQQYRNSDSGYKFRQESDFYYLSGFREASSIIVLCKDNSGAVTYNLFCLPHDEVKETWDGPRAGQDGAVSIYKADQSFDIASIDTEVIKLLAGAKILYLPLKQSTFVSRAMDWLEQAKSNINQLTCVPEKIEDLCEILHELRLYKSDDELELVKKAVQISAIAHKELMQAARPGITEYELEGLFYQRCRAAGCSDLAYPSIVAAGSNACILHYIENSGTLQSGDLLLVDAGGEYGYYAADITRTYPVSGKFTDEQRKIYEIVLAAQLAGIEQVKPGNSYGAVQQVIVKIIVEGLVDLDILHGKPESLIESETYKQFYMHSSGHWLGLDVHDVGRYKHNGEWRNFEKGMLLTVEPGIYISEGSSGVDKKWHGIGIRIEDDVLVTEQGNEVLSSGAPKTIEEIECVTAV